MSDTFNNLIDFIKNDTIMMILCGIIAVLIVVFLIVLIFGKKDKPKKEEQILEENTTQLFTSDIDDAVLKSTSEYNFKNEALTNEQGIPIIGGTNEQTAPIIFDETIPQVKEEEIKPIIEEDIMPIPVVTNKEEKLELPIMELNSEALIEPIVEMPKIEPNSYNTQVFSSVSVDGKEMPLVNEDASKAEIIRHIPESEPEKTEDTSFEDLDLPKLNTNKENSVISSLIGESFKI